MQKGTGAASMVRCDVRSGKCLGRAGMRAYMDAAAARLSSWSMPHRKHGVKTRVASLPAAGFAVGFPS
jgi:hypothetical protein